MQRLLADNAAAGMLGMARALNGVTGVIDPRDVVGVRGTARLRITNWAPAFVNAARVLVAVGAISMFWIASAWPNGVAAITFCAVIVILCPRQETWLIPHRSHFSREARSAPSSPPSWCLGSFPKATTFQSLCLILRLGACAIGISERSGAEPAAHLRGGRQLPADAQHHKWHDL